MDIWGKLTIHSFPDSRQYDFGHTEDACVEQTNVHLTDSLESQPELGIAYSNVACGGVADDSRELFQV